MMSDDSVRAGRNKVIQDLEMRLRSLGLDILSRNEL